MFIAVYEWIIYDRLRTLHIKAKRHFLHTFLRQGFVDGVPLVSFTIEEQKTASSGTSDLAADRSVLPGTSVQLVDMRS